MTVSVDTLNDWENHSFFGEAVRARVSLRYHVLEEEGRALSVRTRADVERSRLDATSVLDDALADALAACTKDFTEALLRPRAEDLVRVGPDARIDVLRSLAAPLWLRVFRDAERRGPYVGAALNLVTGSATIEGVDDVNYFFGVMPEMTLGLRLGLNVRIGGDAAS